MPYYNSCALSSLKYSLFANTSTSNHSFSSHSLIIFILIMVTSFLNINLHLSTSLTHLQSHKTLISSSEHPHLNLHNHLTYSLTFTHVIAYLPTTPFHPSHHTKPRIGSLQQSDTAWFFFKY